MDERLFRGQADATTDEEESSPYREAVHFYQRFLRGEPLDKLREEIEISASVLKKWERSSDREEVDRQTYSLRFRTKMWELFHAMVASGSTEEEVCYAMGLGDRMSPVSPQILKRARKLEKMDGLGRKVSIDTIAKILGLDQERGEGRIHFKSRVLAKRWEAASLLSAHDHPSHQPLDHEQDEPESDEEKEEELIEISDADRKVLNRLRTERSRKRARIRSEKLHSTLEFVRRCSSRYDSMLSEETNPSRPVRYITEGTTWEEFLEMVSDNGLEDKLTAARDAFENRMAGRTFMAAEARHPQ